MNRRGALVAIFSGTTGMLKTTYLEAAAVKDFLHYDRLDQDQFPELKPDPDAIAINGKVLQPPGDSRIPASARRPMLLLAFRLENPPRPKDPSDPVPGWTISFDRTDASGKVERQLIALVERPKDGNYSQRPRRDPNRPQLPGGMYLGALSADLAELYASKVFRSGLVIEISFAQQARTQLKLP